MQLREYAANTRAEYLSAFPELDRNQQSLKTHETPNIESPTVGNALTTVDRYTLAREQITRTALGDTVQAMVQQRSLPELSPEQIATLTVKDLDPSRHSRNKHLKKHASQPGNPSSPRNFATLWLAEKYLNRY